MILSQLLDTRSKRFRVETFGGVFLLRSMLLTFLVKGDAALNSIHLTHQPVELRAWRQSQPVTIAFACGTRHKSREVS